MLSKGAHYQKNASTSKTIFHQELLQKMAFRVSRRAIGLTNSGHIVFQDGGTIRKTIHTGDA